MPNYIQLSFYQPSPETSQIVIALLGEEGYTFEETDTVLRAFIDEKVFDEKLLKAIANRFDLVFTKELVPEKNWNAEWESNFDPVIIGDFVGIRADFHPPIHTVEHEIIITPKMSFGTGHHSTTTLMIGQMREIDFTGRSVVDFGTGTGILAILAEKMGAKKILAIDNDEWSIANAEENFRKNNCSQVELQKAGDIGNEQSFDIILANINRNVLLDNLPIMSKNLSNGGILLLSGIVSEDEHVLITEARRFSLVPSKKTQENNWLCIRFIH